MGRELTDAEIKELAVVLVNTPANVYGAAEAKFGVRPGNEVFERLWTAGAGKCVECDYWLASGEFPGREEGDDIPMCCSECINGDECE